MKYYLFIVLLGGWVLNLNAVERVKGTQIVIEPPTYLEPAKRFLGFTDEEYGTFIMITEVPSPINEVMESYTVNGLAIKGLNLLSVEDIKLGNVPAKLMKLHHTAYELEFTKWSLVFGDNTKSVIIVASFQTALSDELSNKLKETILTARWERDSKVDLFEGLPFKVDETKSLRFAKKISNALILTSDGSFPIADKDLPYSTVAASFSNTYEIDERSKFARDRFMKTQEFKNIEVLSQNQTKHQNLDVEVLLVKAVDVKSNKWKFIHFSMLFGENSYYIIESIAALKEKENIEKEFGLLLASFVEV
ncbi:hypothetical protein [Pseudoalteromonas piratica]|uniref:Uncharacterized protein n=1 Tax=Pseudoalteromonas piratica TaxID=1348114 RepID=A0A0A7EK79_9GAMM|nr:hypothetical protein [Pseudoalteromonas piratica]AIY66471.1 hypothetical protein OM33_15030 [Pseudoalteromonas piratica]